MKALWIKTKCCSYALLWIGGLGSLVTGANAQDAAILRKNMFEVGGYLGASYGVESAHVMGGANVTYSLFKNILPYAEFSYLPAIEHTSVLDAGTSAAETDHTSIPFTDANFGVHLRFRIPKSIFVPYGVVGVGLLHGLTGHETYMYQNANLQAAEPPPPLTIAPSTDFAASFGGGVRMYFKEQFGMRFEFKDYQLTGGRFYTAGQRQIYRATVGMFWQFGR